MKILEVTLKNFGPYVGEHTFALADRGLCLISGTNHDEPRMNSNGSGKSHIMDGLDWALYGQVPRGAPADSVLSDQVGKECCVTVKITTDEGRSLVVKRTRKCRGEKDGPTVLLDGVDLSKHDSWPTQVVIDDLLGLSREVFHAAVLFAQGDSWSFATATDSQRKELLSKIIPELGEVDSWAQRTKSALTLATTSAQQAHAAEAAARGRLEGLRSADPRGYAASWDQGHAQSIATAVAACHAKNAHLQTLLSGQRAFLAQYTPQDLPKLPERTQVPSEFVAALVRAQGALDQAHRQFRWVCEQGARPNVCDTCGQTLPDSTKATLMASRDAERHQAQNQLKVAQEQLMAAQAAHDEVAQQVASQHQQVEATKAAYASQRQVNDTSAQWEASIESSRRELVAAEQYLQLKRSEENPHRAAADRWEQQLAQAQTEQATAAELVHQQEELLKGLNFWKMAFGPKGIKSHILDDNLQSMSDAANRWVSLLTGGTIWVRFETQKKVGKGRAEKLVDDLAIRVFRYQPDGSQIERDFRSWSGGEKDRIALGIDFGLSQLVASRSSKKYDVLFLDEVFQKHLDMRGKEAVADMLRELAKEKSSLFVVDHDPQFTSLFQATIHVEKRNGASKITPGTSS